MSATRKGRLAGTGSAQARIVDALRGGETLRSAELAARAKVNHHSLSKCTRALLEQGQIVGCMVQPASGNKTMEYRIGPGVPPTAHKPLAATGSDVAKRAHRSASSELPPVPVTRPAKPWAPPNTGRDADLYQRVQRMSQGEFGEFVGNLARVWGFAQGRGK